MTRTRQTHGTLCSITVSSLLVVLTLGACSESAPGRGALRATISNLTTDRTWSVPGGTVTMNFTVGDFEMAMDGSADGHFHVSWDDVERKLLSYDKTPVEVKIPQEATVGEHKLIVSLRNNDHTPLSPPLELSISISIREGEPSSADSSVNGWEDATSGEEDDGGASWLPDGGGWSDADAGQLRDGDGHVDGGTGWLPYGGRQADAGAKWADGGSSDSGSRKTRKWGGWKY